MNPPDDVFFQDTEVDRLRPMNHQSSVTGHQSPARVFAKVAAELRLTCS
jgi:hypothetical protein